MGRVPVASARLCHLLASEARRLALLLDAGATALQRAAGPSAPRPVKDDAGVRDSAALSRRGCLVSVETVLKSAAISNDPKHSSKRADAHAEQGTHAASVSTSPASTVHDTDPAPCNSFSNAICLATAEVAVRRLCEWAEGADSWLDVGDRDCVPASTPAPPPQASVSVDWLHAWLAGMVATTAMAGGCVATALAPVAQPVQAHHSLTSGAAMARVTAAPSASPLGTLSEVERTLANTVASCVGLSSRFQWTSPSPSTSLLTGGAGSGDSAGRSDRHCPAQAALMLWPTAMRTTSGLVAPRPLPSSNLSSATAVTALTALPAVASAKEVFAKASTRAPTPSYATTEGGGALYLTALEAYTVLLHTARTQAVTRVAGQHNAFAGSESVMQQSSRLVLYCGDQCDALLVRAAQLLGIAYVRVMQTVAMKRELPLPRANSTSTAAADCELCSVYNYAIDVRELQSRVVEDVAAGLYPLMVVGTFGSGLSGAVDPLLAIGEFCQRLGVWFHIDASHGGAALLAGAAGKAASPALLQRDAILRHFHAAALLADSVMVPTGLSTAVPFAALPVSPAGCFAAAGSVALFFANIRKVAWSIQALGEARQSTFNQWITPGVAESDVLHVSPLSHMGGWLLEQNLRGELVTIALSKANTRAILQPMSVASLALAERVGAHQQFVREVLKAFRSDGRFDASIDAAAFGIVCLRWLTAADEATVQLARVWSGVLTEAYTTPATLQNERAASPPAHRPDSCSTPNAGGRSAIDFEGSGPTAPPVQVFVGLVQLQRRVWIRVSFGPLLDVAVGESASLATGDGATAGRISPGDSATMTVTRALTYVQHSLNKAASRVRSAHAMDTTPGY
ncbi:hypothetical protein LSCM4_05577 [Leishmania orientalis]|uniref:Uncharacterized protein n=1 Tax=Leishmania orientalis TaxID=2249476 RepID=A0A836GY64_9TRYP|nr:hypothetical protein LSCM4_05577 [Leishmania orientalis]